MTARPLAPSGVPPTPRSRPSTSSSGTTSGGRTSVSTTAFPARSARRWRSQVTRRWSERPGSCGPTRTSTASSCPIRSTAPGSHARPSGASTPSPTPTPRRGAATSCCGCAGSRASRSRRRISISPFGARADPATRSSPSARPTRACRSSAPTCSSFCADSASSARSVACSPISTSRCGRASPTTRHWSARCARYAPILRPPPWAGRIWSFSIPACYPGTKALTIRDRASPGRLPRGTRSAALFWSTRSVAGFSLNRPALAAIPRSASLISRPRTATTPRIRIAIGTRPTTTRLATRTGSTPTVRLTPQQCRPSASGSRPTTSSTTPSAAIPSTTTTLNSRSMSMPRLRRPATSRPGRAARTRSTAT